VIKKPSLPFSELDTISSIIDIRPGSQADRVPAIKPTAMPREHVLSAVFGRVNDLLEVMQMISEEPEWKLLLKVSPMT
jgi:hypothetical protein